MSVYVISTKFTAIDAMSSTVRGMANNLAALTDRANVGIARQERLFRKLTPSLGNAAKQLLNYASAGAVLAGVGYSGKAIMDYETAIQSLSAVTGVGGTQLDGFRSEIKSLSNDTKKSAIDVAGSFEIIGSMMSQYLTDPKALKQIASAGITLSKASRQDLVPSLQNLTSVMNQFNLGAGLALNTVNRLTAGEIVGSLRTSEVTEALQEFGAGAYAANVDISESVALVEALGKQMKTDKIGVGARNILTVMDSATGLAKKARKELKHAGVDMHFLMDKTKSLSERLHELSKVAGDSKAITKIFGRENKTAAQVIFNQLGTYDEYLAKIRVTNEAQHQAETNSKTLAVAVDQLKNQWINYIATGDQASKGLNKLKDAIGFVSNNMDTIVSVGVRVIEVLALWKAAMVATRIVTTASSIAIGIHSAVTGASSLAMKGNTIALAAQSIAMNAFSVVTNIATGNFAALSALMLSNPIGLVITGATLLAGAIFLLSKREDELIKKYQEKQKLDSANEIKSEVDAVTKLAQEYFNLGQSIGAAVANSIKLKKAGIDMQRATAEAEIKDLKAELEKERAKLYVSDLFYGALGETGAMDNSGKRGEIMEALLAKQREASTLASKNLAITQFAQSEVENGVVKKSDLGASFNPIPSAKSDLPDNGFKEQQKLYDNAQIQKDKPMIIDYAKMQAAFEAALKGQKVPVINVNQSGAPAQGTINVAPSY